MLLFVYILYLFLYKIEIKMTKENELKHLFCNLAVILKKYKLSELNKAIIEFLNTKNDKTQEVNYILQITSEYYNISLSRLKEKHTRGLVTDAKQMCYCLLYYNLGIPKRQIAKNIFFNWDTSVDNGVKRLKNCNKNIKREKEFFETYEFLSEKLINFITEKNAKEINNIKNN